MVYILLFLWHATGLQAQTFTAAASKTRVAVGEQFEIQFSINTNCSGFKAPAALADFDIYSGPNQSTSMQIINGNVSQSISLSYILAARKEGKFTIGPATVNVSGKRIESNSLTIEVVKGSGQQQQQQQQQYSQDPTPPSKNADENIFAKTSISKTKCFQGEQITVVHKVYTRLTLRGFQDVKFPAYNGFWSQDVPAQQQVDLVPENIDGVIYNVAELKKTYLFPQRSGTLEIEPMEVQCVVRQRSNRPAQSIFEQFFGTGGYEDVVYNLKSKPVKIEVSPLPEKDKPAGFSGAVGNYSFKAAVSKEKVKENEALSLTVSINGKGNLKLIDPPSFSFPEDFETYDPKTSDNVSVSGGSVSGTKSFEYLVIPRHEGEYTISPLAFSYFDPEKRSYVTLPSPEFRITVEKGKDGDQAVMLNAPAVKEDVKMLGSDIRYIKTNNIVLTEKTGSFFGSVGFYAALTTPLLLFIGFLAARRRHIRQNSDIAAVKSRKATRMARKRLALAEKHLGAGRKPEFYDEVFRALYGYLSDRLNLPVSDLSKDSITTKLKVRNVSDDACQQLMATLSDCEFARYAPASVSGDLQQVFTRTVELITRIEDEIK